MASVMHSITDAVGLTDYAGAEAARETATAAQEASTELSEEQLAFQKEQYEDWKAIYGDLQENIGEYYNNLSADQFETQALQNLQASYQQEISRVRETLAQRGLDDSGIAAAAEITSAQQLAANKANARLNAENVLMQNKMQFLGLGLGQGTQMLGIQANVASAAASNLSNYAAANISQATGLGSASIASSGGLVSGIAGAATAAYMMKPPTA